MRQHSSTNHLQFSSNLFFSSNQHGSFLKKNDKVSTSNQNNFWKQIIMDLFISQGFANIGCDILQYLDNQSLCQSRLVCTNWARFITCERFWHRRIIKVRIFQKVFLVRSLYIVSCLPKMNQTTVQKTNLLYCNTEFVLFKFYDNEHIKNGPINTIYF